MGARFAFSAFKSVKHKYCTCRRTAFAKVLTLDRPSGNNLPFLSLTRCCFTTTGAEVHRAN